MTATDTTITHSTSILDISDICGPDQDPAAFEWTVTVTIGDHEVTADVWRLGGWVRPGANQDIDGSGLINWGDSQHGEWRTSQHDGLERGDERLRAALEALEGVDIDIDEVIEDMWATAPELPEPTETDVERAHPTLHTDGGFDVLTGHVRWLGGIHSITVARGYPTEIRINIEPPTGAEALEDLT